MSLIHDALRKAAEENQHGRSERPRSWRDVEPLPPPRPLWPRLALAGGAVLIAGAIAFLALRSAGPAAAPAPAATVAEASKPIPAPESPPAAAPLPASPAILPAETPPAAIDPAVAAPVELPPVVAPPVPAPTVVAPPIREAPAPTPQPAAPQAVAPRVDPPSADLPPAPATTPATTTPATAAPKLIVPPAQTGQVEGDTYVLEAEVEGKRLLLDFIVWSEAPFAQINGRQVGVGQQVEGFLVTAIARDSVLLETPTRKVRLKVR